VSERDGSFRGWRMGLIAATGMLGWALLVMIMFSPPGWLNRTPERTTTHAPYEPATREGPPVIVLRHLESRGFDSTALDLIEPHFHVLNAALVTIVELKAEYDAADLNSRRTRLRIDAVHFHTTADRHEEQIERLLGDELRARFHGYVREREAAAGLHQDTVWHRHEDPAHRGVSPGFDTPRHLHGDSAAVP
jgi:alkylhydroperoxidase family enzyme